jgi:hypothetical protein
MAYKIHFEIGFIEIIDISLDIVVERYILELVQP